MLKFPTGMMTGLNVQIERWTRPFKNFRMLVRVKDFCLTQGWSLFRVAYL
jgi:hypothetical protein